MSEKFFVVNLREYLDENKPVYIGEDKLHKLLSSFHCPLNPDVEHFLRDNAVEFTKKDQSVTYLVFSSEHLVGYFSLAIKPVSVLASTISKTMARKLERISVLDENTGTYTASGYLIAQLGKNFALPAEQRIKGDILLRLTLDIISQAKYLLCGVLEFLECDDNEALMNFYIRNGFKFFNTRITLGENPHKLNQLLKFI
ncbi:MAG: GNAT family acetyltransferase [Synergistaceae bacterium]|nr:GNAT family acetyltransferase [Synergistaceae bacterium]